jgi:hypothetical protein
LIGGFSRHFSLSGSRLFLPISIFPALVGQSLGAGQGGISAANMADLMEYQQLSLTVFATANAQYPEPPILQWIFISDTGFLYVRY